MERRNNWICPVHGHVKAESRRVEYKGSEQAVYDLIAKAIDDGNEPAYRSLLAKYALDENLQQGIYYTVLRKSKPHNERKWADIFNDYVFDDFDF